MTDYKVLKAEAKFFAERQRLNAKSRDQKRENNARIRVIINESNEERFRRSLAANGHRKRKESRKAPSTIKPDKRTRTIPNDWPLIFDEAKATGRWPDPDSSGRWLVNGNRYADYQTAAAVQMLVLDETGKAERIKDTS